MKTNYQLPTTELMQATKGIAEKGGPSWPEWCDLEDSKIAEQKGPPEFAEVFYDEWFYCPPAVAAAVVDFGQQVIEWMQSRHMVAYVSVEFAPDRCYLWGTHGGAFGHSEDRLEAYAALIISVIKALEGE